MKQIYYLEVEILHIYTSILWKVGEVFWIQIMKIKQINPLLCSQKSEDMKRRQL